MATKGTKGMSTTLARPRATPTRKGGVVEAMKSRAAAVGESRTIQIGDIQPNPDNPPDRSQPGEGLVASIREVGVIQDLVLVPLELWRETHPEHDDALSDAPYVVLAGHRRLAAAAAAERDEVPARIREDFDRGALDSVMIHENVHREALTPIEEARAYRRVMDRQSLSQRALSRHTGVPQSQISKKLRLLDLPSALQEAVTAGLIGIEQAGTILVEDEAVVRVLDEMVAHVETGEGFSLDTHIGKARQGARLQQAQDKARSQAEERGVAFIEPENLDAHLGVSPGTAYRQQLTDDKEIAAAQEARTLVVSHSHVTPWGGTGKVEFYTTVKPKVAKTAQPVSTGDTQRRKANKARRQAMLDIVTTPPNADVIRRGLLAWAIDGGGWGSETYRVAQPLLEHAGLVQADLNYWEVKNGLADLSEARQLHAAWILLMAMRDEQVGLPHEYRSWSRVHLEHYAWLTDHGYEPSAWEQDMLAKAAEKENADA